RQRTAKIPAGDALFRHVYWSVIYSSWLRSGHPLRQPPTATFCLWRPGDGDDHVRIAIVVSPSIILFVDEPFRSTNGSFRIQPHHSALQTDHSTFKPTIPHSNGPFPPTN